MGPGDLKDGHAKHHSHLSEKLLAFFHKNGSHTPATGGFRPKALTEPKSAE
jgi:hypothetical protein